MATATTAPKPNVDWIARGMLLATVVLVFLTFWQGWTALSAYNVDMARQAKEEADKKVYEWQTLQVYGILEQGYEKEQRPLTFEEIQQQYLQAADLQMKKVQEAKPDDDVGPRLKSKDIQQDTLRRILMDLNEARLLYVTYPGPKYMIEVATFNPEGPRAVAENSAKVYAFDMLVTESNKYSIEQLATKIAEKYHLDVTDCRIGLDELLANGFVRVDDATKFVSLKSIPPPK